ncbi:MAG: hypothetical protein QXS20_10955, partial [Candidatus Thorarchaeota archaeon]
QNNQSVSDSVNIRIVPDESPPIIVAPENFSYEVGSFGHYIKWNITESNPDYYRVTRTSNDTLYGNETVLMSGSWDGRNITVNVDGLNATFVYTFTLFVNDTLGHNATSSVSVTVYPDTTPPTVTSPEDISYEFGSRPHKIKWFAYDSNPKNYSVRVRIIDMDNTYGNVSDPRFHAPANLTQPNWVFTNPHGGEIIIDISDLYLGNYTFTLVLFDKNGLTNDDMVNVTVYKDLRAPVVNTTGDVTYEEGFTGYFINWTIEESNPRSYNLTRGNVTIQGGVWRGQNISIRVDGLPVGVHVYNLTLVDYFYQVSISIVTVTVTPDAHLPTIMSAVPLLSMIDPGLTQVSFQAGVWDLNGILNVTVEYGTDPSNPVVKNMTRMSGTVYYSEGQAYPVGTQVWYRIVAYDNSSVKNRHATEWKMITVPSLFRDEAPGWVIGIVVAAGILSAIALLNIYCRTKTGR